MSYTTVKAIWPGEKHEDLEELRAQRITVWKLSHDH